ncbi:hypothetical protein DQ04_23941000 [Trypanosoma grayi]|uniref:hypothetical protein n=1 Tax=Trypanosoma grayi TaxID=71804 RepID=UPI0004F41CEF|nr:hypothetical protein DQ04_23941000 [Trypanosoma grayi]KEG05293.1 hypothetical protein DQ04_23941000 [Trypanosoma grayi]
MLIVTLPVDGHSSSGGTAGTEASVVAAVATEDGGETLVPVGAPLWRVVSRGDFFAVLPRVDERPGVDGRIADKVETFIDPPLDADVWCWSDVALRRLIVACAAPTAVELRRRSMACSFV